MPDPALPIEMLRCPVHGIPDCSPLLNGCSIPSRIVLAFERGRASGERSRDEAIVAAMRDPRPGIGLGRGLDEIRGTARTSEPTITAPSPTCRCGRDPLDNMPLIVADCPVHGHTYEPPGPYVVAELSLANLTADEVEAARDAGLPHPEATPVGPFPNRANADRWAHAYVGAYGGGSWSLSPLNPPRQARRG